MAIFSGSEGRTRPARSPRPPKPPRNVQAEQARRGGMSDAAEAAAQDDFASRLMRDAEASQRAGSTKPKVDYSQMSPAARRALGAADEPAPAKQKYLHVTDEPNVRPIRSGGLKPAGRFGHEAVWAYEGGATPENIRNITPGRVGIEFEADPTTAKLRGTTPGSRARGLVGGNVSPESITGGYSSTGARMFNLLGGTPYHGLYSLVAGMLNLPDFKTPADWVMEDLIGQSEISPYRQTPVTLA